MEYIIAILGIVVIQIVLAGVVGRMTDNMDNPRIQAIFNKSHAFFESLLPKRKTAEIVVGIIFVLLLIAAFMESVPSNNPYP